VTGIAGMPCTAYSTEGLKHVTGTAGMPCMAYSTEGLIEVALKFKLMFLQELFISDGDAAVEFMSDNFLICQWDQM
jgi:hypothetical protein